MTSVLVTTPDESVTITPGAPKINITTPDKQVVLRGSGLPGPKGPKGDKGDQGIQGVPGQDAKWERLTQAQYDVLNPKDSQTLYVIIG